MRISDWSSDVCSSDLRQQQQTVVGGIVGEDRAIGGTDDAADAILEHPPHRMFARRTAAEIGSDEQEASFPHARAVEDEIVPRRAVFVEAQIDRKSTRLNSSH